ncbi:ABC transporter permease [Bifidobacterium psychraerophilum]|uniref:ABC transporter permease n=1 Tax=Bifidobacterium psychraerophilum TaxID=218140 RepID=UPI0023F369A3|nr:ABC transporter permease [Bifidobacterium psychraerophilum]MCI1659570.1 ABC transporter permease [Bifidobacterium psychraerophilum]MCI1804462.1 ABC transporter permease [Bifidobacterium psychraerophilum]MCI2176381.1 ABC transporter permease [Bifidobacterium psychraerophilum]
MSENARNMVRDTATAHSSRKASPRRSATAIPAGTRPAQTAPKQPWFRRDPLKRFPGFGFISVMVMAFLYLPMLIVVVYSFNGGNQALLWKGFSLRWYAQVFTSEAIIDATLVSLKVAVIATVVSTVLALAFVLSAEKLSRAGNTMASLLLDAPIVIPEIVMGVATLSFIRLLGMSPGFWPLVFAHVTFCIPFVLMPLRARLQNLDPAITEAAADLGASNATIIARIQLPLLMPGILSGALMAFVTSLDDFMISNFLTSAGSTTLPIYIFGLIRKGINPSLNVVATLLLMLAIVIAVGTSLMQRKEDA